MLTGVGNEYYGPGADPTVLANLQGQGTLAIAGRGNVVVGPNVAVTGALSTEIEASGSTALVQVAADTLFDPVRRNRRDRRSCYSGAPVAAGQFSAWVPIGAEPFGDGYQVAWKIGVDQYIAVDRRRRWQLALAKSRVLSGAALALQSLEPGFHQDLNR